MATRGRKCGAVITALGGATWLVDRDNAGIQVAVALIGWVGGLIAGRARRRGGLANAEAAGRQVGLAAARRIAVEAERRAFAREIHDVVSHAVGVIAVQASAAEVVLRGDPARARASLTVVAETARSTLAELDRVYPEQRAARRTEADLQALVERIRSAGTPVRSEIVAWDDRLADVAYRIVQEALTNVARHAPGARARVVVSAALGGLLVHVSDDGPAAGLSVVDRGYGLIGAAERAAAVGGRLTAGPDGAGSGFRVEAFLPTSPAVEAILPTSPAVEAILPTSPAVEAILPISRAVETNGPGAAG